jgi:CRISPR/Cas system-associated exonuclease Cas4 (RecB family)
MKPLLLVCINGKQMAGDRVNQAIICEKAKQLFEELGAKAPSTSTGPMKEFALGCGPGTDYP